MKRTLSIITTVTALAVATTLVSCDWSSGGSGSGFNTSKTNLDVNISGTYRGQINGKAVSNTSGGNITQLVIQQSGNVVEVHDNQGSTYRGSVGIPNVALTGADGTAAMLPLGAELASYTVSWTGKDAVANRDVKFTGNIEIVTVDDITGEQVTETRQVDVTSDDQATSTSTSTTDRQNNSDVTDTRTTTAQTQNQTSSTGQDNNTTDSQRDNSESVGGGGTQTGNNGETETQMQSSTTTTTSNSLFERLNSFDRNSDTQTDRDRTSTQQAVNNSQTTTDRTDTTTTGNTSTTTETVQVGNLYQITALNTQYRLRGTWIEEGGSVSTVDGVSPAAGGIITIPIARQSTAGQGGGAGGGGGGQGGVLN